MKRPFRFGVQAWRAAGAPEWRSLALRVEELGYSTLLIGDHVWDQFAPVPALMSAADATTTLRVGTLVLSNDFRHPVILAKELATLDVLSGGRLEVGVGAGWMASDYEAAGIPQESPGARIGRLEEAVRVMKGLWSSDPVCLAGDHYQVQSLTGMPTPLQRPHPPLLLGGGGKRMLGVAAEHADIIGIAPSLRSGVFGEYSERDTSERATAQRIDRVREVAGARFDDIELSMMVYVASFEDDVDRLGPLLRHFGVEVDGRHDSPHVWLGPAETIAERLVDLRERYGLSYWVLQQELFEKMAPVVGLLAGT